MSTAYPIVIVGHIGVDTCPFRTRFFLGGLRKDIANLSHTNQQDKQMDERP